MMNKRFLSLLAAGSLPLGPGLFAAPEPAAPEASEPPVAEPASTDAERPEVAVATMAEWNIRQLALGFLAIRKSESEPVRSYARLLVDDAVRFQKELMDLARQKQIVEVTALNGFQRPVELAALENLAPKAFDTAFLKAAKAAAERTRSALRELGKDGDVDLHAFAQRALGDLEWRLALTPGEDGTRAKPPPVGEGPREM